MLGFIVKLFVLVRKVRDAWEWLNCMHVDTSEGGAVMYNVKVWFPECLLFGGKKYVAKTLWGSFSEVANVLQVWDFQSMIRALSALGSVSASRSVHSGRFYCIPVLLGLT